MKIAVVENFDFLPYQVEKIKSLGEVEFYEHANSAEEWLERCEKAEIICSANAFMKTEIYKLKDKFFTIPMVGYQWLDVEKLKSNNITLANCPGCNKYAVSEWVIGMTLELLRGLSKLTNTTASESEIKQATGLKNKNITILGKGNIGQLAGKVFEDLGAKITYFDKNDDLSEKTKNADIIINSLSTNPSTIGLLDKKFFSGLKKGVYFVSITTTDIYDNKAMLEALDDGTLAGLATDCASVRVRDTKDEYYQEISKHPKVLATPHIAWSTDVTAQDVNDIMIENIESYIKGQPRNIAV